MEVIRVTKEEYEKIVPEREVFFNEPEFCDLNKDKVEEVHYLVIVKDNSYRFGLIAGVADGVMKCPFSAPYSYPVEIRANSKVADVDEAVEALDKYCIESGIKEIRFIFPPLLYNEHLLTAWISAFYRNKYEVLNLDLNYSVDLEAFDEETFMDQLPSKGRKHLKKALKSNMEIVTCETEEDMKQAYDIVYINHAAKDRPVRMTFEQLMATMKLVYHEAFIVKLDGVGICTQIFYQTNKHTVQCIYSGFLPEYTNSGAMNLLTYHTICHFSKMGYKVLDRATATEETIPNYGLCDFKESVGCKRSIKYSFKKQF